MIICFIITFIVLLYIIIENCFIINVRKVNLCKHNKDIIKIIHLSDLHDKNAGKNNSRIINKVRSEKPDIIIISGDFLSRNICDFRPASILLSDLTKTAPVYYCLGNHELDLPEKHRSKLDKILSETGVISQPHTKITVKGRKLNIAAARLKRTVYKKNGSYKNLDKYTLNELNDEVLADAECENMLIAHNPFFAEVYSLWGADYAFCGHVHGGIIRFFGFGLLSPERKLLPKYSKGVYTVGKTKLLVSGGLGKLRLFNPPEIVVYYL